MPDDTAPDNTTPKETAPEVAPHAAPHPAVTPPAYTPPVGRLPSFTPPQYAQAEYVRPATSTPPETPRRPLSPLVIGLIVGGAVLLVVAIVASAVTVTNYFTEVASGAREPFGTEPAIEGEKASPLALNPTRCDDECFTEEVVAGAASSGGRSALHSAENSLVDSLAGARSASQRSAMSSTSASESPSRIGATDP